MKFDAPKARTLEFVTWLTLITLMCVIWAWQPLGGQDDVWAHAAVGRWICQHHQVPRETLFLWSAHQPWIDHEWLSQLLSFGALRAFGDTNPIGLLIITGLLYALPLVLICCLWERRRHIGFSGGLFLMVAVYGTSPRFAPRPEIFTALFLSILLITLASGVLQRRPLLWLPLAAMMALWANLHGGVAFGVLCLFLTAVGELIQDAVQTRTLQTRTVSRWMIPGTLLCLAAPTLNPYGIGYWKALQPIRSVQFAFFTEWTSPFAAPAVDPDVFIATFLVLCAALAAWWLNPHRRYTHLLWVLVMSFAFVSARRNISLLCLTCSVVMAANAPFGVWPLHWNFANALKTEKANAIRIGRVFKIAAVLGITGLLLATAPFSLWQLEARTPANQWDAPPEKLTQFLRTHHYTRLLNPFDISAFIEWRLGESQPLYIDHLGAFPDGVIVVEESIVRNTVPTPPGLDGLLDTMRFDAIAMSPPHPGHPYPYLAPHLSNSRHWKVVYLDRDGAVWQRTTPSTSP